MIRIAPPPTHTHRAPEPPANELMVACPQGIRSMFAKGIRGYPRVSGGIRRLWPGFALVSACCPERKPEVSELCVTLGRMSGGVSARVKLTL